MEAGHKDNEKSYDMPDLLSIMKRLRDECPWDAKQTHQSLRPYLLEEAYEVLESIDTENWDDLAAELGDLLLQIIFHSEIAARHGRFDFGSVVNHIAGKLVQRHPHVFGDKELHSAKEVQDNWEHSKITNEKRASILSGIPQTAPALMQAQRMQEKASSVGFDWNALEPVIEKIEEEWQEFKEALGKNDPSAMQEELGDLLFSVVNLARLSGVVAEDALRMTNEKFKKRFQYIEKQYNHNPQAMKKDSLEQLDQHWTAAKRTERDE